MKQIFDWLREQMDENTFNGISENGVFLVPLIHSKIAKLIINEAEAKWEAETCEWKQEKFLEFCLSDCITSCGHAEHYSTGIDKYCRHCGKPIKISEVE